MGDCLGSPDAAGINLSRAALWENISLADGRQISFMAHRLWESPDSVNKRSAKVVVNFKKYIYPPLLNTRLREEVTKKLMSCCI